jgi:hypothetical protein
MADMGSITECLSDLEHYLSNARLISGDMTEDYGLLDPNNPTESEREIYKYSCIRISGYLNMLNEYIVRASEELDRLEAMVYETDATQAEEKGGVTCYSNAG